MFRIQAYLTIGILALFPLLNSCGTKGDPQRESPNLPVSNATGDWNSGGGYALTEAANPWWVGQTQKKVRYCILIDQDHFGQTLERSRELIKESISYWREEFELVRPVHHNGEKVDLTSFEFVEVDCTANEAFRLLEETKNPHSLKSGEECSVDSSESDQQIDLVFQLGLLSKRQRDYIRTPRDYLGLATRTHYDRECLRSKGFIYISPLEGDLAPDRGDLLENRWALGNGALLKWMLIHEVGHLFGMTFSDHFMMNPTLGYTFAQKDSEILSLVEGVPHFFGLPKSKEIKRCSEWGFSTRKKSVFGVDPQWKCIEVKWTSNPERLDENIWEMDLWSSQEEGSPMVQLGKMKVTHSHGTVRPQGYLVLPPGQRVFKNEKSLKFYRLVEFSENVYEGSFQRTSQGPASEDHSDLISRRAMVTFSDGYLDFGGDYMKFETYFDENGKQHEKEVAEFSSKILTVPVWNLPSEKLRDHLAKDKDKE